MNNTLKTFLSNCERIIFTSTDAHNLFGTLQIQGQDSAKVKIHLKFDLNNLTESEIQAVLRVGTETVCFASYGATSDEENREISRWFRDTKNKMNELFNDQQDEQTKKMKYAFGQ